MEPLFSADNEIGITSFFADGTFYFVRHSRFGRIDTRGRWRWNGTGLQLNFSEPPVEATWAEGNDSDHTAYFAHLNSLITEEA